MERLTERDEYDYIHDEQGCAFTYYPIHFCGDCYIGEVIDKLADYEDAEEQGLLPKFHLGDEFWVVHYDGVAKEKIVMLQQKKNGTWKYRFKDTCDFEENDFGKEFFDNKEDAEKRWREQWNKYKRKGE